MAPIIDCESPLYKIPDSLPPVQAIYLDGIRHAVESIDFAFFELQNILGELGRNIASERTIGAYTPPFLFAWSVVDAIYRLRGLLKSMPGLEFVSPQVGERGFFDKIEEITLVRNVSDHLGQRIQQIVAIKGTASGVLKWITPLNIETEEYRSCAIVPGTVRKLDEKILMPKLPISGVADQITLVAGGVEANLSQAVDAVRSVIASIEPQLSERWNNEYTETGGTIGVDAILATDLKAGHGEIPV